MPSKNRLTVNLSEDEYLALDRLSVRAKVSMAWLGRYAISALIENTQSDEQQLPLPFAGFGPRRVR